MNTDCYLCVANILLVYDKINESINNNYSVLLNLIIIH